MQCGERFFWMRFISIEESRNKWQSFCCFLVQKNLICVLCRGQDYEA